jgi:hypothetical protein
MAWNLHAMWVTALPLAIFGGIVVYALLHHDDFRLNAEASATSNTFTVENIEKVNWVECTVTLTSDREYTSVIFQLPAGNSHTLPLREFVSENGLRFNPLLYAAKEFNVQCGKFGDRRNARFGKD